MRWLVVVLIIVAGWASSHAEAGNFKVVPIKVYFENDQKVQTLTLRNDSESDVTLQFEAVEWAQDATGKDQYEPTKSLFIFPGIVTVKAGAEKQVKLGYQGPPAIAHERTYRLYITELPVQKPGEATLQMAMRLGVPVFVVPKKGKPAVEIERATMVSENLDVQVTNPGNRHVYVKTIEVVGVDDSDREVFHREVSGWYVLPSTHRMFSVPLQKDSCTEAKQLRVIVRFANQDIDQVPVSLSGAKQGLPCQMNASSGR